MPDPAQKSAARTHLFLLPLVALLATAPLLVHGPSCGHDFDFHLLSWFEAATQIAHGNLHPHWAFTPAWNAGEPRFVFYPPISWYLGALLGLILPWTWTPIVYTWIALSAAGLACHRLLRHFAPPATALFIAALYIVNPYMLFTAYERTAYAELLCAAWLPLLLLGILRPRPTIPGIALPLALLWLTNAPAAVLATYSLALLALVQLATNRVPHLRHSLTTPKVGGTTDNTRVPHLYSSRVRHLRDSLTVAKVGPPLNLTLTTLAGTTLGFGLAAFYIVPAALERKYVEIALVKAQSLLITDNFLFAHTGDPAHDAVLHTASVIASTLLTLTAAALLTAFLRNKPARPTLIPLTILTAAIAFLLTEPSTPIWLHAPQLAFLQFPWRFVAILTPTLALALALAIDLGAPRLDSETWVPPGTPPLTAAISPLRVGFARHTTPLTLVLSFALLAPAIHLFFQRCDDEDTPAARLALFHSPAGTEPTDEYTPDTDSEDSLSHTNPPYWLATDAQAAPPPDSAPGPLHWPLTLTTPTPEVLILNLRNYPAWHLFLNGTPIETRPEGMEARPDGLIALPLPAGHSILTLTYARTPDQTTGEIVSIISLAALLFLLYRRRRR